MPTNHEPVEPTTPWPSVYTANGSGYGTEEHSVYRKHMDTRERLTDDEQQVTAADIARLAGVTRAAVSNWRRRHDDFPSPTGGTSSSPLFPLAQIRAWLEQQNKGATESPEIRLWNTLRGDYPGSTLAGLADLAEYFLDDSLRGLSDEAAAVARAMAEKTSPEQVIGALTERFLKSHERSGTASVSTPRMIRALTALLGDEATSVFDPACGTGELLFCVGSSGAARAGQDADPEAARFATARARLQGLSSTEIRTGDSLRSDQWPDHRAALVVCDPPPTNPDWGREELLMDPRWELALPPKVESELAWLQHAYAHTTPGGQAAVVMSTSAAYRRTGRRIRAELVRRGLLTHVIALPAGLAASHSQPVHLWLLRRPTGAGDTATAVRMWDLGATAPEGPWTLPQDTGAEVALIDLLDDEVDLTPARHLSPDLDELPKALASAHKDLRRSAGELGELLPVLEPGTPERFDNEVRIGDLIDAGLAELSGDELRAADERLDTDFLIGFLNSPANTRRSTSASGTHRTDARTARVPKMGVQDQRRYGAAFRSLAEFERRAKELAALAERVTQLTREGLTSGALDPRDSGEES